MAIAKFTNLDFDQIKVSIKDYLRSDSNFTDYDFDGSNLSIIIDVLAYNTYINSYNANMLVNETFIDSATLRENIVADFYLTPDYFEKELNTKFGSGFSIQPKFTQSAYFRFHNKSEIYDGLYFVGAGTHPGAGVPGVLSSAKVLDKLL